MSLKALQSCLGLWLALFGLLDTPNSPIGGYNQPLMKPHTLLRCYTPHSRVITCICSSIAISCYMHVTSTSWLWFQWYTVLLTISVCQVCSWLFKNPLPCHLFLHNYLGIIHNFHKHTECTPFTYPLPLPKSVLQNVYWLNLFHVATGTEAKITFLKVYSWIYPLPLSVLCTLAKMLKILYDLL